VFRAITCLIFVLVVPVSGRADDRETVLELERGFAEVVARIRPAVVSIGASHVPDLSKAAPAPRKRLEPLLPPEKRPTAPPAPRAGSGSGVIISPDGEILTNHHVAGGATHVTVIMADGKRLSARIIGTDPHGDLTLLDIEGKKLPHVKLGPDDRPTAGSWVIAMGNPFSLATADGGPIVTQGIVSGLHRIQPQNVSGELFYGDSVQTDAEINPGNSGGPLFDLEGRLVGINGRIATRRLMYRVNTGVGYAISARQIRRTLPRLRAGGTVHKGFLGIRYDVDEMSGAGVEVLFVYPGSPAEAAGLLPGDRIVGIGTQRIRTGSRLAGLLSTQPAGTRMLLTSTRKGREKAIEVVLLRRPEEIGR
jgi:serine protease Do